MNNSDETVSVGNRGKYYKEKLPDVIGNLKKRAEKSSWKSVLYNTFPILKWAPEYKLQYLIEDGIAGLTVGLTAIPQGIAYAVIAGLSPEYGLNSAFMGCFMYILLGTCKDITIGPTAIMSLLTQKYVEASPDLAVLLCFLAGCIITLFGIAHLGFVVRFISTPVTLGFTTAAAITIASGQINPILGIPNSSSEFVPSWETFFTHITEVKLWDALLGVITLVCLLLLRKCKDLPGKWKLFGKYISLSRNALAVIIGTLMAYVFDIYNLEPFRLTGKVKSGLPPFQPPPFSTQTIDGTQLNFTEMVTALGTSIIAIPLVSILESIAIAKAFSKGKSIDASQEMIAVGVSNILSSFVSSMPITGSFTRTAVNHNSGVRTTLGGLFTGVLVLLALGLLTETFYFIPKAVLSAIIISAMIFMVHPKNAIEIWKSKKLDIFPYLVTLLACLFAGLEIGILCGIVVNVFFILYLTAKPKILFEQEKVNGYEVLIVTPNQSLVYSSAEYVEKKLLTHVTQMTAPLKCVVINGESIFSIDSTVALHLMALCTDLENLNCKVILWNWTQESEGVLWRLNKDIAKHFEHGKDIHSAVRHQFQSTNTLSEIL